MKYIVKSAIRTGGKLYKEGDEVELPEKLGTPLVLRKRLVMAAPAASKPPAAPKEREPKKTDKPA
jgi:hypothetical protein